MNYLRAVWPPHLGQNASDVACILAIKNSRRARPLRGLGQIQCRIVLSHRFEQRWAPALKPRANWSRIHPMLAGRTLHPSRARGPRVFVDVWRLHHALAKVTAQTAYEGQTRRSRTVGVAPDRPTGEESHGRPEPGRLPRLWPKVSFPGHGSQVPPASLPTRTMDGACRGAAMQTRPLEELVIGPNETVPTSRNDRRRRKPTGGPDP